jgi:hypothetical protein
MPNDTASARHRPSVAFLPEDEHILRCFGDPKGKPWRCVHMHQFQQRRTHCSNFFREIDPAGTYPACELCLLATEPGNWRLRREALVLIYGSLLFTSHPSTYWRPGKTYLIIAPDQLRESLLQLLKQGNAQQREHFFAMMNPALPGPAIVVQVKKGRSGSITIPSFSAAYQPPVILGEWYKPLRSSWIGDEFKVTDYEAVLAQVTRHHRIVEEDPSDHDHTR